MFEIWSYECLLVACDFLSLFQNVNVCRFVEFNMCSSSIVLLGSASATIENHLLFLLLPFWCGKWEMIIKYRCGCTKTLWRRCSMMMRIEAKSESTVQKDRCKCVGGCVKWNKYFALSSKDRSQCSSVVRPVVIFIFLLCTVLMQFDILSHHIHSKCAH